MLGREKLFPQTHAVMIDLKTATAKTLAWQEKHTQPYHAPNHGSTALELRFMLSSSYLSHPHATL